MTDYPAAFPSRPVNVGKSCLCPIGAALGSFYGPGRGASGGSTRDAAGWAPPTPLGAAPFVLGSREGGTPA